MDAKLPEWLQPGTVPGFFYINADIIYEEWMRLLNISYSTLDHYWYEIVFQCAKMDALRVLEENGLLTPGVTPTLIIRGEEQRDEKGNVIFSKWKLSNFPKGAGTQAAIKEGAAKKHYKAIRGELPKWLWGD